VVIIPRARGAALMLPIRGLAQLREHQVGRRALGRFGQIPETENSFSSMNARSFASIK
jgi:hypothetical protein